MVDSSEEIIFQDIINVSGRVTPSDGVYRAGIQVGIYEDNDLRHTTETDHEGYYNADIVYFGGTVVAKVGDDESESWRDIASINLISDKSIITYNEETPEIVNLTATVLNSQGKGVSNETVVFEITKQSEDSVLETLTTTTNENGVATVYYSVQNTESLNIKAKSGTTISETFKLGIYEWIMKLDGTETKQQLTGSTSISNGVMSGGSSYITSHLIPLNKDWELTCDYMKNGNSCGLQLVKNGIGSRDTQVLKLQGDRNGQVYVRGVSTGERWFQTFSQSNNVWYPTTIRKEGTTITVTSNNFTVTLTPTEWDIINLTSDFLGIGVDTWGSTAYIKNVKLRILD